jgi:hypothetical protein
MTMLPIHTFMKRSSIMPLVSLFLGALVPACASTNTVLDAEDYDQTCQMANDCVAVLVVDVCSCGCAYGAISSSDFQKFQADVDAAREACGDAILDCGQCMSAPPVACTSGTCTFTQ